MQVKYVEDIIVTRDMAKFEMLGKEMVQDISYILQANFHVESYNHFDHLIQEEELPNLKKHGLGD